MSRTPKKPRLVNAIQITFHRNAFISAVEKVCPQVFDGLRSMIKDLRTNLQEVINASDYWRPGDERYFDSDLLDQMINPVLRKWALQFGLEDSWIEAKARDFARIWLVQDQLPDGIKRTLPLVVAGNPLADRLRQFVITIDIPYEHRLERAHFSWAELRSYLESHIQPAFEQSLRDLEQQSISAGVLRPRQLPDDLYKLKYPVAALYLFERLGPEQIALQPDYARERTVLNRWITETTKLLDLEAVRRKRLRFTKATLGQRPRNGRRHVVRNRKKS